MPAVGLQADSLDAFQLRGIRQILGIETTWAQKKHGKDHHGIKVSSLGENNPLCLKLRHQKNCLRGKKEVGNSTIYQ